MFPLLELLLEILKLVLLRQKIGFGCAGPCRLSLSGGGACQGSWETIGVMGEDGGVASQSGSSQDAASEGRFVKAVNIRPSTGLGFQVGPRPLSICTLMENSDRVIKAVMGRRDIPEVILGVATKVGRLLVATI